MASFRVRLGEALTRTTVGVVGNTIKRMNGRKERFEGPRSLVLSVSLPRWGQESIQVNFVDGGMLSLQYLQEWDGNLSPVDEL
ncbi:hypothetical protein E2P81_ATG05162 [Venturia nashicola]|nr:hypothetical protein E2P81_ATG05162 [Venturia nashicola]